MMGKCFTGVALLLYVHPEEVAIKRGRDEACATPSIPGIPEGAYGFLKSPFVRTLSVMATSCSLLLPSASLTASVRGTGQSVSLLNVSLVVPPVVATSGS